MPKFGRIYTLQVEVQPDKDGNPQGNLTITLPFTVDFEIVRQSLSSSQTANFKIYNLSEKTRNLLYKDKFAIQEYRNIQFRAGYDTFKPLLFNGTVKQSYSYRQGINFITEIECYDGAYQMCNGFSNRTVSDGASASEIITEEANSLPKISGAPIVGSFPTTSSRGEVLFGNTWEIIQQKTNGKSIIDSGQVKALQDNEVITGQVPVINSDTGLLGSPKRSGSQIDFDMLFEPRLTVGQLVKLDSQTNRIFNGFYKVMGFTHRGIISPAVNGECKTSCSLWLGTEALRIVAGTPVQ